MEKLHMGEGSIISVPIKRCLACRIVTVDQLCQQASSFDMRVSRRQQVLQRQDICFFAGGALMRGMHGKLACGGGARQMHA